MPTFGPARSVKGLRLRVSPNGRHFVDQEGQPFFYLGDTVWTLLKRLNRQEVEDYLRNRAAKGFTVVQSYVLRGLRVPNLYGELTLVDRDPTRPNDAFFQNVDYITNRANELGLVMGFVVSYGEHVQAVRTDEQVFNPDNAFAFGSYLGRRYRDNAVIWLLGGDRVPLEGRDVWAAMARGLKAGSGGIHLVSYHGPGDWSTPSSSYWFHEEDWLDFNTIQSGHGWAIPNYEFVAHDYALRPVKPTLDMESRYENHPDVRTNTGKRMDAHQAREAAYWAVLAGAAGHGYGCNDMWQLYDPDRKLPPPEDYAFPYDRIPGNTHWRQAMDFGGAYGVGLMRTARRVAAVVEAGAGPVGDCRGSGRGRGSRPGRPSRGWELPARLPAIWQSGQHRDGSDRRALGRRRGGTIRGPAPSSPSASIRPRGSVSSSRRRAASSRTGCW